MSETTELLPCPLCGSAAYIEEDMSGCSACCSQCDLGLRHKNWTRASVIELWNERPHWQLRDDMAKLEQSLRESEAACAALREALEPVRCIIATAPDSPAGSETFERGCGLTKPEIRKMQSALSSIAGTALLARFAELERDREAMITEGVCLTTDRANLMIALESLADSSEVFMADQTGATDYRVGLVQPVSVSDCLKLNEDIAKAREAIDLARGATPTPSYRERIANALDQCPWPADVFTMTEAEYVAAVPDEALRTAISGLLCRRGWEAAKNAVAREAFQLTRKEGDAPLCTAQSVEDNISPDSAQQEASNAATKVPSSVAADSERLDWLEANKERIFCVAWDDDGKWAVSENPESHIGGAAILGEGATVREAIDIARTSEGEGR